MKNGVWEDVDDLGEDLLDQFVSLLQGNIQRSHVPTTKRASYILVLRRLSPTCGMSRSIEFWDHSYTSDHGISNQFSCISGRISLFGAERCMLGNLRM